MFDFDAGKLLIIGIVALIVIGPKELPRVMRQVGQAVGKLRRMASEFQGQFMDAMKEADLQDVRDEMSKLKSHTDLSTHFDPARDIQRELTHAVSAAVDEPVMTEAAAIPAPVPDAATSIAPVEAPEPAFEESDGGLGGTPRKVVLRKRRSPFASSPASPYRNVRPRRQEADR